VSSESREHKRIKDLIYERLKEWTGAALREYPSSGHELDNFATTNDGVSIYVEVIWSESAQNFFRDISMIQTADANLKLVIASPKILGNEKYQRIFQKVVISQRRLGFAVHGELIDGRRVLEEPAYLDTEIKDIVLDLLKTVEKQGKVIGKASELHPPQPRSADRLEEKLFSNLFPICEYPSVIFSSETHLRKDAEVFQTLGDEVEDHPFLLKNRRIYVFDDLRNPSSLFSSVISKDEIIEETTSTWLHDNVGRNDLNRLLNVALKRYCEKTRGLFYDKEHRRFVCLLKNGKDNAFAWRSESKRSRRVVAKRILGEDRKLLFCVHYAVNLRFVSIGDKTFLKIEPTMVFTYDGYELIRSEGLAKLMSRYLSKQYNNVYLGHVRFWAKYLSRLDMFITIPTGGQTTRVSVNPAGVSTGVGIGNEEKLQQRRQMRRVGGY
jgi:hypothetical protein